MTAAVSEPRFRLRLVPIVVTVVLGLGLPYVAAFGAVFFDMLFHLPVKPGANVWWLFVHHTFQLLVALGIIAVLKYWLVPADYGLHLPRGKSYIWPAILWGVFFGLLMTVSDMGPQLLAHTRPDLGFQPTPTNIAGWLTFEGIYVGPTEEIPYRALLVTYLMTTMPGKLHVGRFNMSWAGIIVAVLFALAHAPSFFTENWTLALQQQAYAFSLGVLYAYWFEKSKSVLAPAIGHNISDGVEQVLVLVWYALM